MNRIDTDDDKLRFIYNHVAKEYQLYESYDDFVKAISTHDEKSMKQFTILEERIKVAQKIINNLIEDLHLEKAKRRKIE
jgi:arginyl-tRNA--protein-N-Asp/Glu arginylyltransferase